MLERLDERSPDPTTITTRALSTAVQSFFRALLGQAETAAGEAVDTLRTADDPEAFFIALFSNLVVLMYLGKYDEVVTESNAGVAVVDTMDDPFWAVVIASFGAFPVLASGDFDTARRLLDEEQAVLEPRGEHQMMSWNLGHRARITMLEGRPRDAVELFGRAVELSSELGYMRGIHTNLAGLGDAHLAAGDLKAAELAFIKSLAAAEQMSMVREMLGMIAKIARVRALTGRPIEAVELNATVVADPSSTQRFLGEIATIRENASAALADLQEQLESDEYAAAHTRGASTSYDLAVKKLVSSLSES